MEMTIEDAVLTLTHYIEESDVTEEVRQAAEVLIDELGRVFKSTADRKSRLTEFLEQAKQSLEVYKAETAREMPTEARAALTSALVEALSEPDDGLPGLAGFVSSSGKGVNPEN